MALTQINSTGIKDDVIVNADVKSDAAIAGSKLVAATTSVAGSMSAADKTKLDGVATSANAYVHPNHSGEVTSTADGATVIADDVVDEANLKADNANIPFDEGNIDYQEYKAWIDAGNTPEAAD